MNDTQNRWIHGIEVLNILLAMGLLLRWWVLPSTSVYTLFTDGDTIDDLHRPNAVQQRIEQLSPAITVEDVVRKLHADPALLHSAESKQLFQEMLDTQQALLHNEESLQQIESELNRTALELYESLSPAEQTRIRSRRNTDSVEGVEAQYWRELFNQIETTP